MPTIQDILNDFGRLTKRRKIAELSNYQKKLEDAYVAGERKIVFGASSYGLQNPGGLLLGEFLRRHFDMHEVSVPGNMFYNPESPDEQSGFESFITGLVETRKIGCLRVLDLSNSEYLPEQLQALAQKVVSGHPSLTTLKLDATLFTDRHLSAMLPHLASEKLQIISLRYNHLLGSNFVKLVDQLLRACPALNCLDLTANKVLPENMPPFIRLLTENKQMFVRLGRNADILNLSLKNQYQYFIPSRISIMLMQFDALQERCTRIEMRIEDIEIPQDADARAQIRVLETRFQRLMEQMNTNQGEVIHRLLNLDMIQDGYSRRIDELDSEFSQQKRQLDIFRSHISDLHAMTESTQTQISELETRLTLTESTDQGLYDDILKLKQTLIKHSESIEDLEDAFSILQTLQEELARLSALAPTSLIASGLSSDISSEQMLYQQHFKKMLVRMHMTAMVVSTGLIKINASGKAGKAAHVLNALSGFAPLGTGIGVKMLAYCLQAADQNLVMQRMERLSDLGSASDDVAHLSEQLSPRLVRCLSIENRVQDHHMAKLLSATGDVVESLVQNGFYGALMQVFEMTADTVVDAVIGPMDPSNIEKRAEQDAQLLLAAIAAKGLPESDCRTIDIDRLFLYAVPLLTVVDALFLRILTEFCQQHDCETKDLHINSRKRQQFYGNITESWHANAAFVSDSLEETDKREALVNSIAQGFFSKRHPDDSVGVFYFREQNNMMTYIRGKQQHASWNKTALLPETANDIMQTVMTGRR